MSLRELVLQVCFPGAGSPFPFSRDSLMCSFQRPRRRVPWSSGETTAFCFFAPAGRSHALKTSSSSRETFMVKPIRQLPAHRTTTSCPPTKSHSRLSRRSELYRRLYSSPRHTLPAFISCFYTDTVRYSTEHIHYQLRIRNPANSSLNKRAAL